MRYFYLLVLIYTYFRVIRGNYRTIRTVNELLDIHKNVESEEIKKSNNKFIILIPVLREQAIIEKTIDIFTKLSGTYQLIFITTQKEEAENKKIRNMLLNKKGKILSVGNFEELLELVNGIFPRNISKELYKDVIMTNYSQKAKWKLIKEKFNSKKSTKDLLKEILSREKVKNVEIIHYPKLKGDMAHQLNYACKRLKDRYKKDNPYIIVYNADSVVSKDLIIDLKKYTRIFNNPNVIQQSSIFLENFKNINSGFRKYFLQAVALLQTRWTLAHEVPRIFNQFKSPIKRIFEGAHVVGHGLCIRLNTLSKVNFFPTNYINEDLPLGYLLRLNNEIIYPFFILENSESPSTISAMFNQYKTWFYGVISYPLYIYHALKSTNNNRFYVIVWGMRYVIRGILWLFLSMTWIFLFVYPILVGNILFLILSFFAFELYAPINFYIIQILLNKFHNRILKDNRFKLGIPFYTYLATLPAYLTHSIGPILATFEMFRSFISERGIYKAKTER